MVSNYVTMTYLKQFDIQLSTPIALIAGASQEANIYSLDLALSWKGESRPSWPIYLPYDAS